MQLTFSENSNKLLNLAWPFAKGEVVPVDLSADLPHTGSYQGYVLVRYGDETPIVERLNLTLPIQDLPLTTSGVARVPNQSCNLFWRCWRSADVLVNLQAPQDRDLQLTPSVVELALNRTGKDKLQAQAEQFVLQLDDKVEKSEFQLPALTNKNLTLTVTGLAEAGEYSGKLRFVAPGFKPKDHDFIVSIRDSWVIAVILILIGACASMGLRRYGTEQRPRLNIRQRIGKLHDRLENQRKLVNGADEIELRVLDTLNDRLAKLRDDAMSNVLGWSYDSSNIALTLIEAKLSAYPHWVTLRRQLSVLDVTDGSLEIRVSVETIQNALEGEDDWTDVLRNSLAELPKKIAALHCTAIDNRIDPLREQILLLLQRAPITNINSSQWEAALQVLQQAKERLMEGVSPELAKATPRREACIRSC